MTRTVAAFDFDGTLTRRDSLLPFLGAFLGRQQLARALAVESPRLAAMLAGIGDRDATKERFIARTLTGHPHADVLDAGVRYGGRLVTRGLSQEMVSRLLWHQREGHETVIVSASLDVYLGEVSRHLGVTRLLASTLEIGDDGCCTGRLRGGNCRGAEKAKRLQAYLGDGAVELWAYGDSRGDDEMLAMAEHPMRARRGRLLT